MLHIRKKALGSPKMPVPTLHIGVTGHRFLLEEHENELREKINEILFFIKDTAAGISAEGSLPDESVLRVISPLAQGADILVAEEGVKLGYELQCPLPFARADYEKDFSENWLDRFRKLISKATAILELDGTRAEEGEAYLRIGQVVLAHSDLLIAIWDGQAAKGVGGTGQIVSEAAQQNVPVIWLNPQNIKQENTLVIEEQEQIEWQAVIRSRVKELLIPPPESQAYFRETQPNFNLGFVYKLFRDFVADGRLGFFSFKLADFQKQTEQDWAKYWEAAGFEANVSGWINTSYREAYAWADKLADYYANLYRSSFVTNYLLGGIAVFLALISYAAGITEESSPFYHYKIVPVICEALVILLIIIVTLAGNRRGWHRRWIDYRLIAEQLSQMRFLAPLGGVVPAVHVPAHHEHEQSRNSWVYWYVRSVARATGIIQAKADEGYLRSYQILVSESLKDQIHYHKGNHHRFHRIHERLHHIGLVLFVLTILGCLTEVILELNHVEPSRWFTLITAVFPAFGASCAGILFQGEFERLGKRSNAMSGRLEMMLLALERLDEQEHSTYTAYKIAEDAASIMISEVQDWQVVLQSRPLVLPS